MKDLFVDQEQWVVVNLVKSQVGVSKEYWQKINRKERSTIRIYSIDFVLLNVSEEDTTKKLWENLGNLYQSKYLVNKLFLQNKLYILG